MRSAFEIVVVVALLAIPVAALAQAADYGPALWCNFTTTGLPGGTVNQRLAVYGFRTDPQTSMTIFTVGGLDIGNGADVFGYGRTAPGPAFPLNFTFQAGPTPGNATVRHYRMDAGANLLGTVRVTDVTTTGTFTAVGNVSIACTF